MAKWRVISLVVLLTSACLAITVPTPTITLLSPSGIRFETRDVPGTSLTAFHYSINSAVQGTNPGTWNFDVRSKSASGTWVHENRGVTVKSGDTVHYWVHMINNGLGYNLLNQQWKAATSGGSSGNTQAPLPNTQAPSTGGGSGNPGLPVINTPSGNLQLVFEDNFSTLDMSKWTHEVSLYGGMNGEFQAYTPEKQNSFVRDNTLFIKPTLTADRFGESFLRSGVWDIRAMYGTCTQDLQQGCLKRGSEGVLNPIMSAKLKSKATVKYGRVEVVAKMPRGDWIWPAIWMMPQVSKYGGWPRSGEIDICETRGNRNYGTNGIAYMLSTLHWGVDSKNNRFTMTSARKQAKSGTFADGFHKYVLDRTENYLKVYVDDDLVLNVNTPNEGFFKWGNQPGANIWSSGGKNAPFDNDFYLILNVAVGGTNGFFPEGYNKPWANSDGNAKEKFWNARGQWLSTWHGDDATMQVKSVKMWKRI